MPTAVHELRWADLDPAARAFDPSSVRPLVERLVLGRAGLGPSRQALDRHVDPHDLERAVDRALIAECGAWAAGWRWAASEPGGGGPVQSWCCAPHSLFLPDDADTMASVDRVVEALTEWRTFLEEIARSFATLRKSTEGLALEETLERVAAQLLPAIVERTGAEDAWYATFEQVLGWYLETTGVDPAVYRGTLREIVSGRFHSWIAPDPEVARDTCIEIGRAVAEKVRAPAVTRDALAEWRTIRVRAFSNPPAPGAQESVRVDGHLRYVDKVERARDTERAARMTRGLRAARQAAGRGEPLTFEALAEWQALVLGRPAPFRSRDAYGKGGRERYSFDEGTRAGFAAALADANDARVRVSVRAARAYLDVCFFHPFEDGNARAARLALDHVLTREGLALHAVEPLFVVARSASDGPGAWYFAYLVDYFMGPPVAATAQA
jgi:hypothetical protein